MTPDQILARTLKERETYRFEVGIEDLDLVLESKL